MAKAILSIIGNSYNNTIKDSVIKNNTNAGFYLREYSGIPADNYFYNNFVNNTNNVFFYEGGVGQNFWNTSLDCFSGLNIIGGDCIGGNFWAKPNGTGFSETCNDNGQGICVEDYAIAANNIDYEPLI